MARALTKRLPKARRTLRGALGKRRRSLRKLALDLAKDPAVKAGLAATLAGLADSVDGATKRVPDYLSRQALATGSRTLRETSAMLTGEAPKDRIKAATERVKEHPALAIAGLAGVGFLAGRMIVARARA